MQDDMIVSLRDRMILAAEQDYQDVRAGRIATHKISMLEEVSKVLNRPNLISAQMDNDFLTAVRRWLEPLENKALPAYSIQRDLFTYLATFTPPTEFIRESGIGKVVAYYVKDIRPNRDIKRQAEVLMREWSRPILGTSDDYRTMEVKTREYDAAEAWANHKGVVEDEPEDPLAVPGRYKYRTRQPQYTYDRPRYEIAPISNVQPVYKAAPTDDLMKRIRARQAKGRQ